VSTVLATPPNPPELRRQLAELVMRDLLGPAGGPEEEVAESSVRDRYLVGMLAPRKQEVEPETLDDLATGGADAGDDGSAEPAAPAIRTLFPSAFGMSFSIALDTKEFRVRAHWGQYLKAEAGCGGACHAAAALRPSPFRKAASRPGSRIPSARRWWCGGGSVARPTITASRCSW
jgi:hypothetical protein